ncbi:MAG TPA: hypothetical protein VHW26_12540 [Solirubrobacteraceae bacterium]|jgi:predicted lipoprotein with Yx(FWY)xxD motif|nr:hypothetical protein [Solirubrobacteraceae bacterium]
MTPTRRRIRAGAAGAVAITAAIAAIFGAQAFGRSVAATVGAATNPAFGPRIAVDQRGRTLYTLSPETTDHLLCVSRRCLAAWPPATVGSAHARLTRGSGVAGHLGIIRRVGGAYQLTLRGRPLYRFTGDRAKGQADGDGIHGFGGTWHVVSATGAAITTPAPTPAPTTTTPTTTTPTPTVPVMTPTPTPAPSPAPTPMTTPTTPSYPGGYTY